MVAKELLNSAKACVLVICPLTSIIQDQIAEAKALTIICASLHDLEEVKQNSFPSTSATDSVRFSFALFQCQPYIFTLFCEATSIEPSCFDGWNKLSVSIWRAWLPYWTLKEQPQSREKSFTEGNRAFLLRPTFFFGVSTPPGTRFSTFLYSPPKFIDQWCMSFSVNGISLRPGEVEMKILQSWRRTLLSSPPP